MRPRSRQGIAIVMVLLTIALVALIAGSLVVMGANNLIYSRGTVEGLSAVMAAQAGAQHGARRVAQSDTPASPFTGTVPGGGNYTVTVVLPGQIAPEISATDVLPPGHFYIRSTGITPSGTQKKVGWYVKKTNSLFAVAAFAAQKMTFGKRATTDSWDASVGPYATSHAGAGNQASIGTNSNLANAVVFGTGARVDPLAGVGQADVFVGPNPDPAVISGATAGTGFRMQRVLTSPKPLPPVDFASMPGTSNGDLKTPAAWLANASDPDGAGPEPLSLVPGRYDDVDASLLGSALMLRSGATYYFKKLDVGPGGIVQVDGTATATVTVKVQQDITMDAGGQINNFTQKPKLLKIEGAGSVTVASGSQAYGVLYTPTGKVTMKKGSGSPDFYGSITANEVVMEDDATVHYDRSLSGMITSGAGTVEIVSAQRF